MPEDSGMNPRPRLRSASCDYLSTARQVKNRIGLPVHGSLFAVRGSRFTVSGSHRQQSLLILPITSINTISLGLLRATRNKRGATPDLLRRKP